MVSKKKSIKKIGIIGHGFVGSAYSRFLGEENCYVIDPAIVEDLAMAYRQIPSLDLKCIFICVPTPSNKDGSLDPKIILNVLHRLDGVYKGVIVIKSTILPDQLETICDSYTDIRERLVYYPEFLREAHADIDLLRQEHHIIGGFTNPVDTVIEIMKERYVYKKNYYRKFYRTTIAEARLIKYTINAYLATKITFFNEIYNLSKKYKCDYEVVRSLASYDARVGEGHSQVPGPDGRFGFGGACLPKDLNALLSNIDVELDLLKQVKAKNDKIRKQYKLTDREKSNNIKF